MVTDLAELLQDILGPSYRIERELSGGSMSRLFLATERPLERQVVVKVLPPDLACRASTVRFQREIGLTVRLQHPHILPILTAGARDDILYYVMPYVAGESLRDRLTRLGCLPLEEAAQILREVTDALAFAHRRGVIHRDIKPGNILLVEGHAVLADFGIARALESTDTGEPITQPDLRPGTPAYMAPEHVHDERADLYSLGVVGWEMLTGEMPFAGATLEEYLEARREAAPLTGREAAVVDALLKALAVAPRDRFQRAEDFAAALGGTRRRLWTPASRRIAAAIAATTLAIVAGVGVMRARAGDDLDANLVAIAPFDIVGADGLWREGLADILVHNLDGAGPLHTVATAVVVRQWTGRADAASAHALGLRARAGLVVFGTLLRSGADSVRLQATYFDVAANRALGELDLRDAASQVDHLADSVTFGILRELGRTRTIEAVRLRQASLGARSVPALKAFLQGEQLFRRNVWDSAQVQYERAAALDPRFALAYRRLRGVRRRSEFDSASFAYALQAGALNHLLSPRDSLLVAADSQYAALRALPSGSPLWWRLLRARFATLATASARDPDDPEVWVEVGEARMHYGDRVGVTQGEALQAFERALTLDPDFAQAYFHAIQLRVNAGDARTAARYATEYLSRNANDTAIRIVSELLARDGADSASGSSLLAAASGSALGTAVNMLGRLPDSAAALRQLRLQLDDPAAGQRFADSTVPPAYLSALAEYHGRLRDAATHASRGMLERFPFRAVPLGTLGATAAGSALPFAEWAHGNDMQKLALSLAWWSSQRDTLALDAARMRFDSATRGVTRVTNAQFAPYGLHASAAYLALVRGDTATAIRELTLAPDSICPWWCFADRITHARLLASTGDPRGAARLLDRHPPRGDVLSITEVSWNLERARLASRLGDHARASAAYAVVASAWADADSTLRPALAEARNALGRRPSPR